MRTSGIYLLICALLACCSTVSADDYLTGVRRAEVVQVQKFLLNDQFRQADSICDLQIQSRPADPLGYLFRAATMMGEMTDREEDIYGAHFLAVTDTVLELAGNILDSSSGRTAAWMYLCLGHARVYRALWEARFGSFISAVKLGRAARSDYQRGLRSDSSLYDLYFGLGNYHYWKSAKAGILRWLGIFKNEKKKGISELQLAVDSAVISSQPARQSLIWVWHNEKRYDSVIAASLQMLMLYPDGKIFLWPLASARYESRRYDDALETLQLLRSRLAREPGNYYNLIEVDWRIFRCFDKLSLPQEATEVARRTRKYRDLIPNETARRQRSKLAELRRAGRR